IKRADVSGSPAKIDRNDYKAKERGVGWSNLCLTFSSPRKTAQYSGQPSTLKAMNVWATSSARTAMFQSGEKTYGMNSLRKQQPLSDSSQASPIVSYQITSQSKKYFNDTRFGIDERGVRWSTANFSSVFSSLGQMAPFVALRASSPITGCNEKDQMQRRGPPAGIIAGVLSALLIFMSFSGNFAQSISDKTSTKQELTVDLRSSSSPVIFIGSEKKALSISPIIIDKRIGRFFEIASISLLSLSFMLFSALLYPVGRSFAQPYPVYGEEVVSADLNSLELQHKSARLKYSQGEFLAAKDTYYEIIKNYPDDIDAKVMHSLCRFILKEITLADLDEKYRKLYDLFPDHFGVLVNLAEVSSWQQDYEEALVYFRKALDIAPDNPDILRRLAEIHKLNFQYGAAISYYDKLLEIEPGDMESRLARSGLKNEWELDLYHGTKITEGVSSIDIFSSDSINLSYRRAPHATISFGLEELSLKDMTDRILSVGGVYAIGNGARLSGTYSLNLNGNFYFKHRLASGFVKQVSDGTTLISELTWMDFSDNDVFVISNGIVQKIRPGIFIIGKYQYSTSKDSQGHAVLFQGDVQPSTRLQFNAGVSINRAESRTADFSNNTLNIGMGYKVNERILFGLDYGRLNYKGFDDEDTFSFKLKIKFDSFGSNKDSGGSSPVVNNDLRSFIEQKIGGLNGREPFLRYLLKKTEKMTAQGKSMDDISEMIELERRFWSGLLRNQMKRYDSMREEGSRRKGEYAFIHYEFDDLFRYCDDPLGEFGLDLNKPEEIDQERLAGKFRDYIEQKRHIPWTHLPMSLLTFYGKIYSASLKALFKWMLKSKDPLFDSSHAKSSEDRRIIDKFWKPVFFAGLSFSMTIAGYLIYGFFTLSSWEQAKYFLFTVLTIAILLPIAIRAFYQIARSAVAFWQGRKIGFYTIKTWADVRINSGVILAMADAETLRSYNDMITEMSIGHLITEDEKNRLINWEFLKSPGNGEAQERIKRWMNKQGVVSGIFGKENLKGITVPKINSLNDVKPVTILVFSLNEKFFYTWSELLEGQILNTLRRSYPDEWANRVHSLSSILKEKKILLLSDKRSDLRVFDNSHAITYLEKWANLRLQTLYNTMEGARKVFRIYESLFAKFYPQATRIQREEFARKNAQVILLHDSYPVYPEGSLQKQQLDGYFSLNPELELRWPHDPIHPSKSGAWAHVLTDIRGEFLMTLDADHKVDTEEITFLPNLLLEFRDPSLAAVQYSLRTFNKKYNTIAKLAGFGADSWWIQDLRAKKIFGGGGVFGKAVYRALSVKDYELVQPDSVGEDMLTMARLQKEDAGIKFVEYMNIGQGEETSYARFKRKSGRYPIGGLESSMSKLFVEMLSSSKTSLHKKLEALFMVSYYPVSSLYIFATFIAISGWLFGITPYIYLPKGFLAIGYIMLLADSLPLLVNLIEGFGYFRGFSLFLVLFLPMSAFHGSYIPHHLEQLNKGLSGYARFNLTHKLAEQEKETWAQEYELNKFTHVVGSILMGMVITASILHPLDWFGYLALLPFIHNTFIWTWGGILFSAGKRAVCKVIDGILFIPYSMVRSYIDLSRGILKYISRKINEGWIRKEIDISSKNSDQNGSSSPIDKGNLAETSNAVHPVRVMFIQLSSESDSVIVRPLSIEALAGDLQNVYGDNVRTILLDMRFESVDSVAMRVKEEIPHIIGLSVRLGTLEQLRNILVKIDEVSLQFEYKPKIILGNTLSTFAGEGLLQMYKDAIIVIGEGEESVRGIVGSVASGRNNLTAVPNLLYMKDDNFVRTARSAMKLSEKALPLFESIDAVVNKKGHIWLEASRGCNGNCTFCSRRPIRKLGWNPIPAERVIEEARLLVERYGVSHLRFTDDDFSGTMSAQGVDHTLTIAKGIKDLGATFDISARADSVYSSKATKDENKKKKEIFRYLKESGLSQVFLGIESGAEGQLKRFAKRVTVEENKEAVNILRELGIQVVMGFIMIDYLMTLEELFENIKFLEELDVFVPTSTVFVSDSLVWLRAQEGSVYKKLLNRKGLLGSRDATLVTFEASYKDKRIARIAEIIEKWKPEAYRLVYVLKNRVSLGSMLKQGDSDIESLEDYLYRFKKLDFALLKGFVYLLKEESEIDEDLIQDLLMDFIEERSIIIEELLNDIKALRIQDSDGILYREADMLLRKQRSSSPIINLQNILAVALLSLGFTVSSRQAVYAQDYRVHLKKFIEWLEDNRDTLSGLPYSHVGDERFENWTITYDAAMVSLAYMASGKIGEAKKIIDFYISTPNAWRLGGIIEAVNTSNPALGEDWSVRTGSNLWMGIASLHLYVLTGEQKYLDLAKRLADWAISLQENNEQDFNFGGIRLGPLGEGHVAGDQHLGYDAQQPAFYEIFASEHNIDAFALFGMLSESTQEQKYAQAQRLVLSWLKNIAYNKEKHYLNRGALGSKLDTAVATDVQSWGISALGKDLLDTFDAEAAEKMIDFVEKNSLVTVDYVKPDGSKARVNGVDFVDKQAAYDMKRKPLISPEWTFQFANAYTRMERYYKDKELNEKAEVYGNKAKELKEDMLVLAGETPRGLAFPYASLAEARIGHEYQTPREGNFSAIGTAYAILALIGFDPLYMNVLEFRREQYPYDERRSGSTPVRGIFFGILSGFAGIKRNRQFGSSVRPGLPLGYSAMIMHDIQNLDRTSIEFSSTKEGLAMNNIGANVSPRGPAVNKGFGASLGAKSLVAGQRSPSSVLVSSSPVSPRYELFGLFHQDRSTRDGSMSVAGPFIGRVSAIMVRRAVSSPVGGVTLRVNAVERFEDRRIHALRVKDGSSIRSIEGYFTLFRLDTSDIVTGFLLESIFDRVYPILSEFGIALLSDDRIQVPLAGIFGVGISPFQSEDRREEAALWLDFRYFADSFFQGDALRKFLDSFSYPGFLEERFNSIVIRPLSTLSAFPLKDDYVYRPDMEVSDISVTLISIKDAARINTGLFEEVIISFGSSPVAKSRLSADSPVNSAIARGQAVSIVFQLPIASSLVRETSHDR
ncbi:MAG: hypothetical protein COX96_00645, partial [Candidatus Omnitrophica bacterium CG_4_10_14_0_2_um_filter_44_9]